MGGGEIFSRYVQVGLTEGMTFEQRFGKGKELAV